MGLNQTQVREVEVSIDRPSDEAARKENVGFDQRTGVVVSSGTADSRVLISDVPETRYLERVTFAFIRNPTDRFFIVVRVLDENGNTVIREFANPQNMPYNPEPAIKLHEGWSVNFGYNNRSSAEVEFSAGGTHRSEVER